MVKEPEYLVVCDRFGERDIYYHGDSEVEAYKNFKRAKGKGKVNIFKAYVYTQYIRKVHFISRYEILEVIK